MGLYGRYVLPRLLELSCSARPILRQRAKLVPRASGRVLEVGFGSGLNLPYYDGARVRRLFALEPSPQLWSMAAKRVRAAPVQVEPLQAPAEQVPLDDGSIDTIVVTFTLCSIADTLGALSELRRVLDPAGRLLFCEHGAAPDASVRRWQRRLNPVWRALSGGCNLDREVPSLLEQAGFRIQELNTMYIPGWRPASFNYWGSAARA